MYLLTLILCLFFYVVQFNLILFEFLNKYKIKHTICWHVLTNIIYFGLNCTDWIVSECSEFNTAILLPFSAFQIWILPSDEPHIINWESGENEASSGMFLILAWVFDKSKKLLNWIKFFVVVYRNLQWMCEWHGHWKHQ